MEIEHRMFNIEKKIEIYAISQFFRKRQKNLFAYQYNPSVEIGRKFNSEITKRVAISNQ